ncbi:putative multi antimicrobial extrusion protein [Helianthus annuus]|uniref:Protein DETOXIFICATION n=1 Tax=Helianthus annuus TaxID=4232 RepID=A0A251RNF8_HELAN|nr:protein DETOXIFICATION 46, chloroplastic [Helianthus annuus]KAF5754601.1 putative multi antimicrobial extrusion protein [Helianthus annuus]KAJ0812355.1 putative multi antimicrobial extrusion protein [Helianthus annuus]
MSTSHRFFTTNPSSHHHKHTQIINTKTLIPHTYYPHIQLRYNYPFPRTNLFRNRLITAHVNPSKGLSYEEDYKNDGGFATVTSSSDSDEDEKDVASKMTVVQQDLAGNESLWEQLVEILKFSGPAAGLWLGGPLMSLIDTAVIGQSSSVELAALGPSTVLCDYMSYVFMFLSVATSNLVATSLAKQDKSEVQHQISTLLFVGLTCGVMMFLFTRFWGEWALSAFSGAKDAHMLSAANTYIQIRGLAWPAILVGWVAQSASLGMKDSWGPLKALAVASVINGVGDVVLCLFFNYGIAGAAWATMASQVVAGFMMIESLKDKGYNGYAIAVPSANELLQIFQLAAPVFMMMMSKVSFYSLLIYFATSMGTQTVAAHQVLIQIYSMFTVGGEPLSQTAQSFMPELIYGAKRSLSKARMLLKSLVIIGASCGLILGVAGTIVPWLSPKVFSPDPHVIKKMHTVLLPYFIALSVTACTHSLEGTLLAGRDLRFISVSMTTVFTLGGLLLLLFSNLGFGLPGCWWTLALFQWSRFTIALLRLISPNGILYSEDMTRYELGKASTA